MDRLPTEDLMKRLQSFRDDRGWSRFHTPKNLALSVSIEAGELLELFQWKSETTALDEADLSALASEVADVFIYLLLLCDRVGVDLGKAALEKIELNERRFPVHASAGIAKPLDATKKA